MERLHKFDTMKGLLIILVVLGHFFESVYPSTPLSMISNVWIYSWHMPLFMYIAGRFAKTNYTRAIYMLLIFALCQGWFMFALGAYLLLMPLWKCVTSRKWQCILVIATVAFALIGGYLPEPIKPSVLIRTYAFLPYFLAGYYQLGNWTPSKKRNAILAFIGMTFVSLVFAILYHGDNAPFYLCTVYAQPHHILTRILVYLLGFGWIRVLDGFVTNKCVPIITKLGQSTMWLYVLHLPWLYIARPFVAEHYSFVTAILATIVTLAIWWFPAYLLTKCEKYMFKTIIPTLTQKLKRKSA